jgi:hypothetical protein
VYECFVKFKLLVEKQFSSSIKQLQSDGGGEYTSSFFQAFLSKRHHPPQVLSIYIPAKWSCRKKITPHS